MPKKPVCNCPPPAAPRRLRRITRAILSFTCASYDDAGNFLGEEPIDGSAVVLYPWTISSESLTGVIDQIESQLNGF
jgi:hypothetical protein